MEFDLRDTIDNQYKIIEKHQGGMSTVYIVLDEFSLRRFAIKTVRESLLGNRNAIERFIQEARMWMNLGRHPHLCEAVIFRQLGEQPLLFLEYVDGGDVQRLLDQEKRLFLPQFLTFALQVCDAMEYIHNVPLQGGNRGIIHRDLKPANFMLNRQCQVKIADFGLAKVQGTAAGDVDPGRGLGTYLYMPPEQFLDAASADRTSDIYAFGVAMYVAVTGRPPVEADSVGALVHNIRHVAPAPPSQRNSLVPPALDSIILRCLSKSRADRYPTFAALAVALQDAKAELDEALTGREEVLRCNGCGYQTQRRYLTCPVCASSLSRLQYGEDPQAQAVSGAAGAVAAPVETDEVTATLYRRAEENYAAGRLPQALSLLRQVIALAPEHVEAVAMLDRVALDLARQKSQTNGKSYNWPMFRGNVTRSGYTPEVLPPPLALAWRTKIGDWTICSPVVADGTAYVGSHVDRSGQSGRFYAIDVNDGRVRWSLDATHEIIGAACVIAPRLVCLPFQNRLVAFGLEDGRKLWELRTNDNITCGPAYWQDAIYFGSSDGNVYAAKADTGALMWTFAAEMEVTSSPAVWDGRLYIGSADHRLYALNATDGLPLWEFTSGAEISGSPAIQRDRVYAGSADHRLYCLDVKSGRKVWEFQTGGEIHSSPAVLPGLVVIGSRDRRLYALDADRGECKWYFQTGDWVESSPAISGRSVYFGSLDGKVYCAEIETGVCLWEYKTDGEVRTSPAVSGNKLFVGSNDGHLYCFRAR